MKRTTPQSNNPDLTRKIAIEALKSHPNFHSVTFHGDGSITIRTQGALPIVEGPQQEFHWSRTMLIEARAAVITTMMQQLNALPEVWTNLHVSEFNWSNDACGSFKLNTSIHTKAETARNEAERARDAKMEELKSRTLTSEQIMEIAAELVVLAAAVTTANNKVLAQREFMGIRS